MLDHFKRYLSQGKYDKAEKVCTGMEQAKLRDIMIRIAYDTGSISVYGFIRYMIDKYGDIFWIELAIDVMMHSLCFIEGSYSIALFHSRQALALERTVANMERIIFFSEIPEALVDKEEVEAIAREILKHEPDNQVVQKVCPKAVKQIE